MKKIVFILLFIIPEFIFAQNKAILDSVEQFLKEHTQDDTIKVNVLLNASLGYESINRLKAFDYTKKALKISEELKDQNKIGSSLNHLGDLYWYSGDYTSASTCYFKALKIFEGQNDMSAISDCYRNIGWIYQGQDNYDLTIQYYKKALDINLKYGYKRKLISNYDDLGIVEKLKGNYKEAIVFCKKAISLSKELKINRGIAAGYGNLGSTYQLMGEYALAIESFQTSSKIHLEINDVYNMVEDYNGLADCYIKLNQPSKAIEYSMKALELSKQQGYKISIFATYQKLAIGYALNKDYANAYNYLRIYNAQKDSTYNEQNSRQINEMSAKYESDKKELMINSLEKEKNLSDEKAAQDRKFKLFMILFSLIVAGLSVVLFRGNLQKKKANNSLSLAYKEIEVQNKDITDSINYAKQIQRARLSNPEIILKHLPDAFGLYKPKDVVSGDFYWFAEHENGKLLLAAADCTGHGIPGAFMSLIGIDELNHATLEKRLSHTSTILSSVNRGVKKALRQNEKDSASRDGMDIALCIFDLKNKTLEYSGANRPLYYIRDNKLHEIAPTKAAIGGTTSNDQEFKSHLIDLKKDDMIYVFTDGYADQFGGPDGKKFMTKQFKELLLSIHSKPAAEQESLLEKALNNWKKDISQVDDILVMGIRI